MAVLVSLVMEREMKRKPLLSTLSVFGAVLAWTGYAVADSGQGYGWYGDHPMMWGGMFMGPVMMALMIGLLVVAVVVVLKIFGFNAQSGSSDIEDRSLAILNERFAKGEIDKAEYEERKKSLAG